MAASVLQQRLLVKYYRSQHAISAQMIYSASMISVSCMPWEMKLKLMLEIKFLLKTNNRSEQSPRYM